MLWPKCLSGHDHVSVAHGKSTLCAWTSVGVSRVVVSRNVNRIPGRFISLFT